MITCFSGGSSGSPMWYVSVSGDKIRICFAVDSDTCSHMRMSVSSALLFRQGCVLFVVRVMRTASWLSLGQAPHTTNIWCWFRYCWTLLIKQEVRNCVKRRLHVRHRSVSFHLCGISASLKNM